MEQVLERTGYREALKVEKTIEAQSRLENIDEFLSVTKTFEEASEDKSLVAFLTDLALVADIDKLDDEEEEENEQVILMTLHCKKSRVPGCFSNGYGRRRDSLIADHYSKIMKWKRNDA